MSDARAVGSGQDRWASVLTRRFLRGEVTAGRSPRQTATALGCSENTVRDHLARHGLLDVEAPKQISRDYEKLGSITAVAHHHDVSFATARRWLLSAGVELNEAHRPELAGIDIDGAARRYESGESLETIARDLGIGVNTLKRRLEARGVQMRARGPQPKTA